MTTLPGSSYANPIWHRGWRIWPCATAEGKSLFAWAHEAADLDDPLDRRHGDAPSIQQAKADIDAYLGEQGEVAEQRSKAVIKSCDCPDCNGLTVIHMLGEEYPCPSCCPAAFDEQCRERRIDAGQFGVGA